MEGVSMVKVNKTVGVNYKRKLDILKKIEEKLLKILTLTIQNFIHDTP